jgi:hypothetical protein
MSYPPKEAYEAQTNLLKGLTTAIRNMAEAFRLAFNWKWEPAMGRFWTWVYRRLGYRPWYITAMVYEKGRQLCGYPPATYNFTLNMRGRPAIMFSVGWNRRTWRLDFLPEDA